MKKIFEIKKLSEKFDQIQFPIWFDKLTFPRLILLWAIVILMFAFGYYFFSSSKSYLLYNVVNKPVDNLFDAIYFSFIIATSTGFGDIVPIGAFKIISVFEVFLGLLLLAFVTSRLVSLKQDIILNEIYEISYKERINRLRSSLLVFRQNISRIIAKSEEKTIKKALISDIPSFVVSFKDTLEEVSTLIGDNNTDYKKNLDLLNAELIFNSILQSLKRIHRMAGVLNEAEISWKDDKTINAIKSMMSFNDKVFEKLQKSKVLLTKEVLDLMTQKNAIINDIEKEL